MELLKIVGASLGLLLSSSLLAGSALAPVNVVAKRVRIEAPAANASYAVYAKHLRLSGSALVSADIDAAGRASNLSIARSSGSRYLDQAALRTVRRSQFIVLDPAREVAVNVPVNFQPSDGALADY